MEAIHNLAHGSAPAACDEAAPAKRKMDAERLSGDQPDDMNPSRGILASLLFGGGLWVILLTVGWLIFR